MGYLTLWNDIGIQKKPKNKTHLKALGKIHQGINIIVCR